MAMGQYRRQCFFQLVAMEAFRGSFVLPRGVVPGDGKVIAGWGRRTRLHSPIHVPSLFCKVQGPVCNFRSLLGLVVSCVTTIK
ncbi:hypothetical protein BRADI_2g24181v3 [Brachypodium distachyon]|uniref:Uncharacterized protein n=1 Tax=Brachypodium distachyon TaxID=15368 RepID=A0A2K2DA66_BRADI|nr:hypothetical protein BRADI_2g24181v3 [Brachypodium distachyon]